jgi:hypothetical protein
MKACEVVAAHCEFAASLLGSLPTAGAIACRLALPRAQARTKPERTTIWKKSAGMLNAGFTTQPAALHGSAVTNENTKGLVRRYFPKHREFTTITPDEIDFAVTPLNNRPRKTPQFKTRHTVSFK